MSDLLRQQLLDTTRGRIVDLLQSSGSTADDLATRLGVSKSAVRVQLTAMERDGVVVRTGKRPGTTRPSYVFELTPESRRYLSKAYLPLLAELVGELEASLPGGQLQSILRRAGKRLARGLAVVGRGTARDLRARVAKASELMNTQLGAQTYVERNSHYVIQGTSCPLAALTSTHPTVCLAVKAWLTEVVGARVHECCERAGHPRCRFEIRQR